LGELFWHQVRGKCAILKGFNDLCGFHQLLHLFFLLLLYLLTSVYIIITFVGTSHKVLTTLLPWNELGFKGVFWLNLHLFLEFALFSVILLFLSKLLSSLKQLMANINTIPHPTPWALLIGFKLGIINWTDANLGRKTSLILLLHIFPCCLQLLPQFPVSLLVVLLRDANARFEKLFHLLLIWFFWIILVKTWVL